MKLYNEIKAELLAAREADQNAQEWKAIAKDNRKSARILAEAAKKTDPSLDSLTVKDILERIESAIDVEAQAPADSDMTDYSPGDIPANNMEAADPAEGETPYGPSDPEEQEA